MKWKGRRSSTNVSDRRGQRARRTAGVGAAGAILNLVGRSFGMKGIIILIGLFIVLSVTGVVDPTAFMGGTVQTEQVDYQPSAEEQLRFEFVKVVLASTEDVWSEEFRERGASYPVPQLVIYTDLTNTACGQGQAAMGPFYCPADRTVYVDLGFYDELERTFEAPGDFAQAYVIAHEVGHHVQNLLGTSDMVHRKRGQSDYNQWSVRLELQADFYAGVWAHHNREYLEQGDIHEAMRAANAIGDDAIQGRTRGKVVPHSFTHGTSEQRMRWFNKGLQTGEMEAGNTFEMPYSQL
jgi:predicted metalloprotease